MKLSELAGRLKMEVARVERDCEVEGAELCASVRGPRSVTFLEKEKFLYCLEQPGIAAVICTEALLPRIPARIPGVLVSDAPKFAFYCIHNDFAARMERPRVPTVIGKNCDISPAAWIAPYNVRIGDHAVIEPGVIIQENVTIGRNAWLCAGVCVGLRSFSPARYRDQAVMLRDCGQVVIGDNVEICAQSGVAQGILADDVTFLGDGVKLDNMVHIGHGARIGARTFIASGAHVAGNCVLGENIWLGVNATISNRIKVGDGARVSLGAVVTKDVPAGMVVTGNFAIEHHRFLRNLKASLADGDMSVSSGQTPPPCELSKNP